MAWVASSARAGCTGVFASCQFRLIIHEADLFLCLSRGFPSRWGQGLWYNRGSNGISRYHLPWTLPPDVRIHKFYRARDALSAWKSLLSSNMSYAVCLYEEYCAPHGGCVWFYREQLFLGARDLAKLCRQARDPTSCSAKMPGWYNLYTNEWTIAVFVRDHRPGISLDSFLFNVACYSLRVSLCLLWCLGHFQNDDVDETGRRVSH